MSVWTYVTVLFTCFAILACSFVEANTSTIGKRWAALNNDEKLQVLIDLHLARQLNSQPLYEAFMDLRISSDGEAFDKALLGTAQQFYGRKRDIRLNEVKGSNFTQKIVESLKKATDNPSNEITLEGLDKTYSESLSPDDVKIISGLPEELENSPALKMMIESWRKDAKVSNANDSHPATPPLSEVVKPARDAKPASDVVTASAVAKDAEDIDEGEDMDDAEDMDEAEDIDDAEEKESQDDMTTTMKADASPSDGSTPAEVPKEEDPSLKTIEDAPSVFKQVAQ